MFFLSFLLRSLSLRRLVLLGFALAVLPLVMAIASAVLAVEELAVLSQKTVYQVAQQTQQSRGLLERLNYTERKGLQYLIYRDDNARSNYNDAHDKLLEGIVGLRKLSVPEFLGVKIKALDEETESIHQWILQHPIEAPEKTAKRPQKTLSDQDKQFATESFQNLKNLAKELVGGYTEFVDQEALDLETRSRGIQRRLLMQSAMLLPVSAALITFFVYLITRPIRRMDRAIRGLGSGDFSRPIRVLGPKDLEYLGERLEWLRTRLISLEEAKQTFMRNVSHEIKTPLATIHEGTELLADEVVGELNPEQREIAQIMVSNTQRLDALIAELINYSQVNSGIHNKPFQRVDMVELIRNKLEDYQLQFRAKSLDIKDHLEPVSLLGSPEQLRTVVDNLLSNAVKYSPVGGEIRISLIRSGKSMELEVEDDGPGVDASEREHVFEPFFQGRAAREMGVKGTGFGLAIVSECVSSHQGTVEALEPRKDKTGARIRVHIPLR